MKEEIYLPVYKNRSVYLNNKLYKIENGFIDLPDGEAEAFKEKNSWLFVNPQDKIDQEIPKKKEEDPRIVELQNRIVGLNITLDSRKRKINELKEEIVFLRNELVKLENNKPAELENLKLAELKKMAEKLKIDESEIEKKTVKQDWIDAIKKHS